MEKWKINWKLGVHRGIYGKGEHVSNENDCLRLLGQDATGCKKPVVHCMVGQRSKIVKDFKFAPLMFVTLGLGSQISLLRAIFRGLGAQSPRVQTPRVQRTTP